MTLFLAENRSLLECIRNDSIVWALLTYEFSLIYGSVLSHWIWVTLNPSMHLKCNGVLMSYRHWCFNWFSSQSKMQSSQQQIHVFLPILALSPSALYQLCFLSPPPRFYLGLVPGLSVHCYIITWFTPWNTGITITFIISTFYHNYLPFRCSWIQRRN